MHRTKKTEKLKAGWVRVKFGDVVRQSKEKADPETSGLERYIAGDHMNTDDLRLQRWGDIGSGYLGPAFHMRFRAGQVLYGSRRTYLRKVAVAHFDGICANTTFVLESKDPKVLLPDYLPFLMQTEAFNAYSVKNSKGSVNPYINFSDLARFEFYLPTLEEQRGIVNVIETVLTSQVNFESARDAAAALVRSASISLLKPKPTWKAIELQDLATVERGKFSHRPRNLPEFFGGPYPFAQTGDIVASTGNLQRASQMLSDEGLIYSKSFPKGSILMTIAANIGYTAITTQETWCTDSVVGIVPRAGTDVHFLEYILRTKQKHLENHIATQTAQKNINLQDLKPLRLGVPDYSTQLAIAEQLLGLEQAVAMLNRRLSETHDIRVRIANELVGGGYV
jgi:type I restriction enzyme, S subunit